MRITLITLAAVLAGLLLPGAASAATCSDYSNQAAVIEDHPEPSP